MAFIPLLGYEDDGPLLGWLDDEPLLAWFDTDIPTVPGLVDAVGGPLGGPVGERVYTISATLYPDWGDQGAPTAETIAPAVANFPVAGLPIGTDFSGTPPFILRAATMGFATLADDPDLPSVYWDDRVRDPGSLSLVLPLVPVGDAAIQTTVGRAVLDNTDGAFDVVLDTNSAVSHALDIKCGRLGAYLEDFVTIFRARITGVGLTETEATLDLQDPVVYAQNLYPTTIYTGAGGAAGDAELEGIVKPVVLGRVWNMSPVLINAVGLIFQVHDGAVSAITGVFDGGVALTFSANFASYAALAAASVTAGQYATCLAAGLIRVGGTPAFALTAHVDGHSSAGITVRSIATWLVGQLDTVLELDVDAGSFAVLPLWTAGWVWADAFTFAEAISRFVGDGGYHWGADTTGLIRALRLDPPNATGSVTASYSTEDIFGIERAPLPGGYEGVHHRRIVRYRKNWTVQSDGELAATAANRPARQREWKTSIATVAIVSRNAIDPPVLDTSLADSAAAGELATHLLNLHGAPRRMVQMETRVFGSSIPRLGDQVRITYPRFDLRDGKVLRAVALDLRLAESASHLLLWG